jgi:hypothetical protein
VPLFIRVEPMITSGPVSMTMGMSTSLASGEPGTLVMPTVSAPSMFARRITATVYGVVPEAAIPTTASSAFTSAFTVATAASSSSSAPSAA